MTQTRNKEAHELLNELWAMEATLEVEIWDPPVAHTSPTSTTVVAREDQLTDEVGPSSSGGVPHLMRAQFPRG